MSTHRLDPTDRSDAILERILRDLDRGAEPDPRVLRETFPGHESTVERLCALVEEYRRALRGPSEAARARARLELRAGDDLGDFVVESLLAEGGLGVVYRARQRSLGMRPVALKVVPDDGDPDAARCFAREALLAASLHHPSLAEVYGFGSTGLAHFYAMQLVEGPSLREILEERVRARVPLDTETTRAIVARVREVAEALECVHRAGLVHRDVKPGNVVLASVDGVSPTLARSRATLVDFGLARSVDRDAHTRGRDPSATPAYAAPEQLVGGDVGASADVFGLGVTLHDLLAGRRPDSRAQASAGLEPVEQLARVDRDLAAIVGRAVDPVARWRYADASELVLDLRAWERGGCVSARRRRWPERASRWLTQPRNLSRLALRAVAAATGVVLAMSAHEWISGARAANESWRGDDLVRVLRAAELPDAVRRLALEPPVERFLAQAEAAVRCRHEPPDPGAAGRAPAQADEHGAACASRVASLLESGATGVAYDRVRVCLGKEGWRASRDLTRLVAHEIARATPRSDSVPASRSWRFPAVSRTSGLEAWATARDVAHGAPDLGPDRSSSRPIRDAACARLSRGDDSFADALRALELLAACGTVDSIDTILAWCERAPRGIRDEGTRLALFSIEGILRRECTARAPGAVGSTIPRSTWTRLTALLDRVTLEAEGPLADRLRCAVLECAVALTRLDALDAYVPPWRATPGTWGDRLCLDVLRGRAVAVELDAIAASLRAEVRVPAPDAVALDRVEQLGVAVAFARCAAATNDAYGGVERAIRAGVPAACVQSFESGLRSGAKRWESWCRPWKYGLPGERSGVDATIAVTRPVDLCEAEWRRLGWMLGAGADVPRVLGAWDFRRAELGGSAPGSTVRVRAGMPAGSAPGRAQLRLVAPGTSSVSLPIGADPPASKLWRLHLAAQFSTDDYRPYQGGAIVRVRMDGEDLSGPVYVVQSLGTVSSTPLRVPSDASASSELTIELDPDSPSECWILLAVVTAP